MSNNFHWVGTDTSYNTAANWSSATGGAGGYGVPTSADNVIFDYGSQNCIFDIDISCGGIISDSNYSGSISTNGYDISAYGDINFNHAGGLNINTDNTVSGDYIVGSSLTAFSHTGDKLTFIGDGNLQLLVAGFDGYQRLYINDGVTVNRTAGLGIILILRGTASEAPINLGNNSTFNCYRQTICIQNNNTGPSLIAGTGCTIDTVGIHVLDFDYYSAGASPFHACTLNGSSSNIQMRCINAAGSFILQGDIAGDAYIKIAGLDTNSNDITCGKFELYEYGPTTTNDLSNSTINCTDLDMDNTKTNDVNNTTFNCSGNVFFNSGITLSNVSTSIIKITDTCNFTSNGQTLGDVNVNTAAQILTFTDALTCDNLKANPAARLRFKGGETYNWSTFNELDWAGEAVNKITLDTDGGVAYWSNPSSMKIFNCNVSGISAIEEVDAFVTDGNVDNGSNTNFDFTETFPTIFSVTWDSNTNAVGVVCSGAETSQNDGKVEVSETGESIWIELDAYAIWSDNLVSGTIGNLSADSYDVKLTNDDGQSTISIGGLQIGSQDTTVQATYRGESVTIVGYSKLGDSTYPIYVDGSYNLITSKDFTVSGGTIIATGAVVS